MAPIKKIILTILSVFIMVTSKAMQEDVYDINSLLNLLLYAGTVTNDKVLVKQALEDGANVNYPLYNMTFTLLHYAARTGKYHIAELLLKHGAKVDAQAHYRTTPLLEAAEAGKTDLVELLLNAGADINHMGTMSYDRPLTIAARNGHLTTVQTLIARGAKVNQKNFDGNTALMEATQAGHENIVGFLLTVPDIDVLIENRKKQNALNLFKNAIYRNQHNFQQQENRYSSIGKLLQNFLLSLS